MNKFRELHDEHARPTVPEARNSWGSANGGGFGGLGLSHVALSHEWANNAAASAQITQELRHGRRHDFKVQASGHVQV